MGKEIWKENITVKATSDIFIKYLFGMDNEESNKLVLSFINAVMQDSGFPAITKVIHKNPFNYKQFVKDKLSILDIKVEDERKKLFNIEVQSSGDYDFSSRALYYWSKLYTSQLENKDDYKILLPTIGINILNFILLPELPAYHNFFMITEAREKEYILTDHLVLHFLELPKLENVNISSKIVKWLLYFKAEGQDKEMMKILLKDDDLRLAHDKYESFTNNRDLRWLAIDREKAERDKIYHKNMAIRQGREEGLKQGIEKGIEKGRKEEKLEEAEKMILKGLSIDDICEITGLSILEVKELEAAIAP